MTKSSFIGISLACALIGVGVTAAEPPRNWDRETIDGTFEAYGRATRTRDWKTLFLLGTAERQDADILEIAIAAATSKDDDFRKLVEARGLDWKQFDREWTDAENERLLKDFPIIAASLAARVTDKVDLFVAARNYIEAKADPVSTRILELRNLVRDGSTAAGESLESSTIVEHRYDALGNKTGQVTRNISRTVRLYFRQVDGRWYLATGREK